MQTSLFVYTPYDVFPELRVKKKNYSFLSTKPLRLTPLPKYKE